MHLRVLADVGVLADEEVRGVARRVVLHVLARRADDGVRADAGAAPERDRSGGVRAEHRVGTHDAVRAEGDAADDVHARAELAVGADDGVVADDAERARARGAMMRSRRRAS